MNSAQKVVFNTFVITGGKILELAISLVSIYFITHALGVYGYGLYNTVLVFCVITASIADLGISTVLLRNISIPGVNEKKIFSSIFTLKLIISAILILIITPVIGLFMPYAPIVKEGIFFISISYYFLDMVSSITVIFQKNLSMHIVVLVELLSRVVTFLIVWWAYETHKGVIAFLMAILASSIFYLIFLLPETNKHIRIKLSVDLNIWWDVLKDSLPIAASTLFVMVYFKFDTVLLSLYKSASDVGIYSASYKILETMVYFPGTFMLLIMPLMTKQLNKSLKDFKYIFQKAWDAVIMVAFPVTFGIFMLSGPIIRLMAGSNFNASVLPLKILSFAIGTIFLSNVLSYGIISLNLQRKTIYIYILAAILNVSLNLIFIPAYSYLTTSSTTVITEVFVNLFLMWLLYKEKGILLQFKNIWKIFISTGVMVLFLWIFRGHNVFLLIAGGCIVYFAALLLVKGVNKEDLELLLKKPPKDLTVSPEI